MSINKIKKLGNSGIFENVKNEMINLHDNIVGFKNQLMDTTMDVERYRRGWAEMLSMANLIKTKYLIEFEGMYGTKMKDFLLAQILGLTDLINAIDTWLNSYRHDGLYVYDKPLDATELTALQTLIEARLE